MNNNLSEKSIKQKVINFFKKYKEDFISFLPVLFALILIIPVPYYVTVGGGVLPLENKIEIKGEKKKEGVLASAYVKEMKSNVLFFLLSYVVPSYEKTKVEDVVMETETAKEYEFRSRLYFTTSIDNATKVAFEKAGKDVIIDKLHLFVSSIVKEAKTDLKIGDEVISIEKEKVNSFEELASLLEKYHYKEEITIKVKRNNKEINCYAKFILIEKEKKLGITIIVDYDLKTDPNVILHFGKSEQGPSGGLMLALNIYNKLSDVDITKGNKIVGTGTIDFDGKVGEIGGVKYKVMGAAKDKADLFLVPKANYEEAIKVKEKYKYNLKIVAVETFDETLLELSKLEKK